MNNALQLFIFVIVGVILLWFGSTLFTSVIMPVFGGGKREKLLKSIDERSPGDPQTCPVCSAKLNEGQLVSSTAYPSLNGGKDRFMHIRGCVHCLIGGRNRVCPVCGVILMGDEILVSRLFDRPGKRSHVHVIGCSNCKGPRATKH
ncbi:MAG: hypothetical protein FWG77_02415 [Treponema sp.]|nr:hypothetical protein [Treponema sp.]